MRNIVSIMLGLLSMSHVVVATDMAVPVVDLSVSVDKFFSPQEGPLSLQCQLFFGKGMTTVDDERFILTKASLLTKEHMCEPSSAGWKHTVASIARLTFSLDEAQVIAYFVFAGHTYLFCVINDCINVVHGGVLIDPLGFRRSAESEGFIFCLFYTAKLEVIAKLVAEAAALAKK